MIINTINSVWGSGVCQKTRYINTDNQSHIAFAVDDNFLRVESLRNDSGGTFTIYYYDTTANAEAGGATGLLATGITAINSYIKDNGWLSGQAVRIEENLGATLQLGTFVYKALPTDSSLCGVQNSPYLAGNAKVYDGSFDYDTLSPWTPFNTTQAFALLAVVDIDDINKNMRLFSDRSISGSNLGLQFAYVPGFGFLLGMVGNPTPNARAFSIYTENLTQTGVYVVAFCFDGLGNLLSNGYGYVNDIEYNNVINTLIAGDNTTGGTTATIGRENFSNQQYFDGRIRKLQIVKGDFYNTQEFADARNAGSFEGIVADSEFLLDTDFNKTSGNLTDRVNPITYTANGGAVYTKFIP